MTTQETIPNPNVASAFLLLPFRQGRRVVSVSEIVRLEGIVNYTRCHFRDGSELVVALTLKVLLSRLPDGSLIRLHQKHAVNRAHIASVQAKTYAVQLTNGDSVEIARRRVGEFKRAMRT